MRLRNGKDVDNFGDSPDNGLINRSELTKMSDYHIGAGVAKLVYKGKYRKQNVAICQALYRHGSRGHQEAFLLKEFDHVNIVRFIGLCPPDPANELPLILVTELGGLDLLVYMATHRHSPPSILQLVHYMQDIANGLTCLHMHKPPVCHGSVKAENILYCDGVLKMSDFGVSRIPGIYALLTVPGTRAWMAPERCFQRFSGGFTNDSFLKGDVYACGVLFWELLVWDDTHRRREWLQLENSALGTALKAGKRPDTSGLAKKWHPALVTLVEMMWKEVPAERPSMPKVCDELRRILSTLLQHSDPDDADGTADVHHGEDSEDEWQGFGDLSIDDD